MSIKIQKIIRFIPILNLIPPFWCIIVVARHLTSKKIYWNMLFKWLLCWIISFIIMTVAENLITNHFIDTVVTWLLIYCMLFFTANIAISTQEKIISKKHDDS